MLRRTPDTRQAAISIYDAKEIPAYKTDTPCTYAVQFSIIDEKLCMSVYMRSNDLWYGFCNDQYQFASLQEMVAYALDRELGWYYHHAHNMHLYNNKI
jgi:thymidylate synthase